MAAKDYRKNVGRTPTRGVDAGGSDAPTPAPLRLALLAGAAAVIVSLNALGNGLAFDSGTLIGENRLLRSLSRVPEIFASSYWGDIRPSDLYRPLTITTYALNHAISGIQAWSYHLADVLLAGGVAALATIVAFRLAGRTSLALLTGLLFALHPIHTEAVANIVGRADLLAAVAVLGLLLIELSGPTRWIRFALAPIVFLGGLLCKENAVTLLPILFLLEWRGPTPLGAAIVRGLKRAAPYVVPLAIYLVARHVATGSRLPEPIGMDNPIAAADFPVSTMTAIAVLGRYLAMTFWPVALSPDYSFAAIPLVTSPIDLRFLGGLLASAALLALALRFRRAAPIASFGALFYVVTLLPLANILFPIGTILGERLLYLPSFGICLVLAALFDRALAARLPVKPALVVVLALFAVRTFLRNPEWKDNLALFTAAVRVEPRSAKNQGNLGQAELERGLLEPAQRHLEDAIRIEPGYVDAWGSLGSVHFQRGEPDEARRAWERAVELQPGYFYALSNLGVIAVQRRDFAAAETWFRKAVAAHPRRADLHLKLAETLVALGRKDDAQRALEAAIDLGRDDPELLLSAGNTLIGIGGGALAVRALDRAVALAPQDARLVGTLGIAALVAGDERRAEQALTRCLAIEPDQEIALFYLCQLRATANDPAVRDPREALRIARRLVAQSPDRAEVLALAVRAAVAAGDETAAEDYRARLARLTDQ